LFMERIHGLLLGAIGQAARRAARRQRTRS
jgi:hypothetical protein